MKQARLVMEVLRTLAAVVAASALLFHAGPSKAQTALSAPWSFAEPTVETWLVSQSLAWRGACVLTKTACESIPPPYVGYALLSRRLGTYEIGSRTVLIDLRLLGQPIAVATMVHEMVHYLQAWKNPDLSYPPPPDTICADEKEAHELTTAFVRMTGIADKDPRVNEWKAMAPIYKCLENGRSLVVPHQTP